MSIKSTSLRELKAHTGLIPKVILLKLFLDMLSRSPADNVTTFVTGGDAFVEDEPALHHVAYVSFASGLFRNFESDLKITREGLSKEQGLYGGLNDLLFMFS